MMIIKAILDVETMTWEHVERVSYSGPWMRCDRAAQQAAKQAEKSAVSVAGQEQGAAGAERNALTPFYHSEMNAEHAYQPQQLQELLSAAGTPLAASAATTQGQANSEAARTRNTSGFSAGLDQAARDRNSAMGTAGLNVAAQDVEGAQKLRQEGASGMSGLFGTDTNAMLGAMGQQHEDINSQIQAGQTGWYQNTLAAINALKPGASGSAGGTKWSVG